MRNVRPGKWFWAMAALTAAGNLWAEITVTDFSDEAEHDAFLATGTVNSYLGFQALGSELRGGETDSSLTVFKDLTWSRNNEHDFILNYDGSGNLNLTITPPSSSPTTISFQPTSWFNYLAFSIESNNLGVTGLEVKNLSINSQSVRDMNAPSQTWDGLLFHFENNGPGNVDEFIFTGTFTPSSPAGFAGLNAFTGKFYLAQVEESGPSSVSVASVTKSEFDDAFANDRIWGVRIQPGGPGSTGLDSEFKIFDQTSTFYEGNTTIEDKSENPFLISVSNTNFLSVTVNGVVTPGGSQLGITESFNTIYVGLYADNVVPGDTVEINTHRADTTIVLSDMQTINSPSFTGFKFHFDDKLDNIGKMDLSGILLTDLLLGAANDEDYSYTVFATYNPDLEAEVTPIELGSFIYDHSTGNASLTLQAAPSAAYVLKQSTDPGDFRTATTITPTAVSTGSLNGNQVTTDATGKAVIQFNLGTAPRMFVRGERP
jgi:hypothetical protein